MPSSALQAADSLATSLIHRIPGAVQPAFTATIQYYQTKALIGAIIPLLITLILIPAYNYYLDILKDRVTEAKEHQNSYDVNNRTLAIALYKNLAALPFIILAIFFISGLCDALPFFLAPQVATALALLHK